MKILILTYGSRGDVQPYVALGKGLKDAGHDVTLATSDRFQTFVENHGLNYAYMSDEVLGIVDTDEGKDLLEKGSNLYEMIRRGLKVAKKVKPAQRELLENSWQAAKTAQPDFIIFHPKAGGAAHIAEKLDIKCALATPIPMMIPTTELRFPVFPDLKLGGWYTRTTYKIIQFMINRVWSKYTKDFRKRLELPPIRKFDFLKTASGENIPVIHAHSEAVIPRPEDWPDHAYITGYWFLNEEPDWTPPQGLLDFLDAGPPPVYIGFGSMAGRNPQKLAKTVIGALEQSGTRGIIATGWGGLKAGDLPDNIYKLEQAPHSWLFPKMAAVVHHGGAGTTAAGLRAGKPTIIIPFFGDQPFWGQTVHKLGAGPAPIFQKTLNAERLASAITQATTHENMIKTAREIGEKIRNEDGVSVAISLIERLHRDKTHTG